MTEAASPPPVPAPPMPPAESGGGSASTKSSTADALAAPEAFWPFRGSAFIVAIIACSTAIISIILLIRRLTDAQFLELILAHGPAIVGIPAAALFSVAAVAVARCIGGPATIQVISFRVEGATATLLLWITAFLACVVAIRALW